jgi:hypothetical protein
MFHVDKKKLLKEERDFGVANVSYFSGTCLTCEHSPDRENRAACPRANFFSVISKLSSFGNIKTTKHLCSSWLLCSEITSCFKKNTSTETTIQTTPQNGYKGKFHKYNRDEK